MVQVTYRSKSPDRVFLFSPKTLPKPLSATGLFGHLAHLATSTGPQQRWLPYFNKGPRRTRLFFALRVRVFVRSRNSYRALVLREREEKGSYKIQMSKRSASGAAAPSALSVLAAAAGTEANPTDDGEAAKRREREVTPEAFLRAFCNLLFIKKNLDMKMTFWAGSLKHLPPLASIVARTTQ